MMLAGLGLACTDGHAQPPLSQPVILVLGDSISAEYGLPRGSGWVELLRQRLGKSGFHYTVANASISGDTTAGGLSRLPPLLDQYKPSIVIVELGGNDGLQGKPISEAKANLEAIIMKSKARGAKVVLTGMELPPNFGRAYTTSFQSMYSSLAQKDKVALVPFLFAGIETDINNFQADRIHPTAAVQSKLLDNVWPQLQSLLPKGTASSRSAG